MSYFNAISIIFIDQSLSFSSRRIIQAFIALVCSFQGHRLISFFFPFKHYISEIQCLSPFMERSLN